VSDGDVRAAGHDQMRFRPRLPELAQGFDGQRSTRGPRDANDDLHELPSALHSTAYHKTGAAACANAARAFSFTWIEAVPELCALPLSFALACAKFRAEH
jgi:hypothetical protein